MDISSQIGVIGGGIAGLACARELASRGADVVIVERARVGAGASRAAAGMLAPLVEARLVENRLAQFGMAAIAAYPDYVQELQEETGSMVDLRREGTLLVATDRDEGEMLRHRYAEHVALGLPVEQLNGYECRQLEPQLSPGIPGGLYSPQDLQIDNRRLLEALFESCRKRGVTVLEEQGVGEFADTSGRLVYRGATVTIHADTWVVATGAMGPAPGGMLSWLHEAVHPEKGQIIRLDQSQWPLVEHVVRSPRMYLVPKSDGRLVLGASAEDRGFDDSITAGQIFELLRAAWECIPGIYELPIVETTVGFRPATVDHHPIIGATEIPGVFVATGYFRHGILFAPLGARVLAAAVEGGTRMGADESQWLELFSPERFGATVSQR